ncbi:MAG: amidohydrolase family protein, partial [Desulfobacca sp.]|uniref:amidohydrolase family protein n=1 Tax=Desulfobacca sp. TaxID=2067990 RepID=UPI00404A2D00
ALPVSAAAHAPYSVAAPLFQRLAAWNRTKQRPGSVHLGESPEELRFLQQGDGPLRELLKARGRWYAAYRPPGSSPAVYLEQLGFWQGANLAVHGVWLTEADRAILARRGVFLALCPRSNRHTGVGLPDVAALHRAGVRLTLGTDSLASSPDFNLFKDIELLSQHCPEIPLSAYLTMATWWGAHALGRQQELGSLSPGKRAALLWLPLPVAAPLWPGLLEAGVQGQIYWLTPSGKERRHGT